MRKPSVRTESVWEAARLRQVTLSLAVPVSCVQLQSYHAGEAWLCDMVVGGVRISIEVSSFPAATSHWFDGRG